MTSASRVFVADKLKCPSSSPIGVYGPTMNTSSSPITSGGSNKLASTPASQTRGNGKAPLASAQASGVPSSTSTTSVIPPDSAETASGASAPGALSELVTDCQDRWVSSAITG